VGPRNKHGCSETIKNLKVGDQVKPEKQHVFIIHIQTCNFAVLELIIINYNMYRLICNKYILYNGLSNYIRNKVIKLYIGFIICHEKWLL
jgi:hypothetical protein